MSAAVIQVRGIGKQYRVGERERYQALRDVLSGALKQPWRVLRRRKPEKFWALKDVSFEVQQGEVVGLIGRNGAGKTTLLKILSRITRPTAGRAEVRGRVGSLLEVGTGFHPELTGRENVYLSGAILGMSKREISRKFEEMVAFAEVERFIDTALKHYSSGMQMRLAFAVAAHLEPEILLVDEVLAVGDIAFQKKCLGKMEEVSHGGRTILFVSHQMNQIRRLCQRALWMDGGAIRKSGPTAEVVGAYEVAMAGGNPSERARCASRNGKARFLRWEIAQPKAAQPNLLTSLGPVTFRFTLELSQPARMAHHGIALFNSERQLMWAWAAHNLSLNAGSHALEYSFPMLPLRPGAYFWEVSLYEDGKMLDFWSSIPELIIATEIHQHYLDEWNGILNVPSQFVVRAQS